MCSVVNQASTRLLCCSLLLEIFQCFVEVLYDATSHSMMSICRTLFNWESCLCFLWFLSDVNCAPWFECTFCGNLTRLNMWKECFSYNAGCDVLDCSWRLLLLRNNDGVFCAFSWSGGVAIFTTRLRWHTFRIAKWTKNSIKHSWLQSSFARYWRKKADSK